MVMSELDIRTYLDSERLKIEPRSKDLVRENGIDLCFSNEFLRLKTTNKIFDTHKLYKESELSEFYEDTIEADKFLIKPHERILVKTLEYMTMPKDLMGFCNLRSTYARLGVYIPPTAIAAGWKGNLVIAMEGGDFPITLYSGDRFLHVILMKLSTSVEKGYTGPYQDQRKILLPKPDSFERSEDTRD